jgi:hypothetical protein
MAHVTKIADFDTSPNLLLDMIKANVKIKSIVVSIINDDGWHQAHWTAMQNKDLSYHLACMHHELMGVINSSTKP